jgi:hypothetical protein
MKAEELAVFPKSCCCNIDYAHLTSHWALECSAVTQELSQEHNAVIPRPQGFRGASQGLCDERSNLRLRGGPIELEQMGSAATPVVVHCLYAGRHL